MNALKIIKSKTRAFTLLETVIAISFFSIITFFVSNFIVSSYRIYYYDKEQSMAVDQARRGVETMIKELREARDGDNGSYPIETADDKQIVFYSDIDNDGKAEKIRYFLGTVSSGSSIKECSTASSGGTCSVIFSNFLSGSLQSAQIRVSADGDFDASNEYFSVSADGATLDDNICGTSCLHCAGDWQGTSIFDVISQAGDDSITFLADASSRVGKECPSASPTFAMKTRFELTWSEEVIGLGNELKRGVTEATGSPAEYPSDDEQVSLITPYVRNDPPIFRYYDSSGAEISNPLSRLNQTKLIGVFLVINIDPNRPPTEFQLQSFVKLRNLEE
jgi:hypothetical protein